MVIIKEVKIGRRGAVYVPIDLCKESKWNNGKTVKMAICNGVIFIHPDDDVILALARVFNVDARDKVTEFMNEFFLGGLKDKEKLWEAYCQLHKALDKR